MKCRFYPPAPVSRSSIMQKLPLPLRRLLLLAVALFSWLSSGASAYAQTAIPLAQTGIAKTMIGWLLVLLAVGLGLIVVCRPAARQEKKKSKAKKG